MDHFDARLREEFGLTPIQTRWLVAWDLKQPKAKPKPATLQSRPKS